MIPETDKAVGEVVGGRFRILKQLGEGGMGTVFLAEHVDLGSRFAVKVMHPELARDPQLVDRFRREARIASRIQHRNIVYLTDFGNLKDGRLYMVMEYVDGRSLTEDMKKEGPIPPARALDILIQVADAMQCAHEHGVVHRDLKPDNIMLLPSKGRKDSVKIIDFGLAKPMTGDVGKITRRGTVLGTPLYMSPEQRLGHPVDHRTDIYSFGAVAYECLTGTPVFEPKNAIYLLKSHTEAYPDPPSSRLPRGRLPEQLDQAILRCLAKKPEDRYQNFLQIRRLLDQVMESLQPPKRKPHPGLARSVSGPAVRWDDETAVPREDQSEAAGMIQVSSIQAAPDIGRAETILPVHRDEVLTPSSADDFGADLAPTGTHDAYQQFDDVTATTAAIRANEDAPLSEADTVESMTVSPDNLWQDSRFQRRVQEIATILMDARMAPPEILDSTVAILNLEEKVFDTASQAALGESRLEELQLSYEERIGRLRRAVVELNLERSFLDDQGGHDPEREKRVADLTYQISELDRRLLEMERSAETELAAVRKNLDRKKQAVDEVEGKLTALYRQLYDLLQDIRPRIHDQGLQKQFSLLDQIVTKCLLKGTAQ